MMNENGKFVDSIVDGYLSVKPTGTIASLLPWPKKWITCDLIDGLLRIYNKEGETECSIVIHLPGSEFAVDAKEPLQFSIDVKHPQVEQHHFRAETNQDYTLWIDTVRACGASSRTTRRTLSSTTSYSSRSSLISRCSSTDTDAGQCNGDQIEGITRRLQSLEESVYSSDEFTSDSNHTRLAALQQEVDTLKKSLEKTSSVSRSIERHLSNNSDKVDILDDGPMMSPVYTNEDYMTYDSTSKIKHSLELAQQMCINARQWETRYMRLSLQYLKLQTFLQHIDSGFMQHGSISEYVESNHMEDIKTIAEFTDCQVPLTNGNSSNFVDHLGFRTELEGTGMFMRYMCQQRLQDNILAKLEPTDTLYARWTKLLEKTSDSIKYSKESKELCRHGIPGKLRTRIWNAFINHRCSKLMKSKGPKYYQSLVQSPEISPSDKQISLDLHRSFPKNVHFSGDQGAKVPVLQRVLVAFSLHNRAIGYCQGMNMIAGMLLFHLEEEAAFWGLVAILEMIMPSGYYNTDLLAARADQIIFQELVESKLPCLAAYLKHHDIDLSLFSFNWFMTIFIDCLPISAVIRLWDLFLLEGHKTLLRFSLSLVKLHEFSLMQHHDSVSIFNMFRTTARSFYDSNLIIKLAYTEFKPFPKRSELFRRHSEKLGDLRTEHAENERQWRERQQLPDSVDRDTWDIVPAEQSLYPLCKPSTCILHAAQHGQILWAVQSRPSTGVVLLRIDLGTEEKAEEGDEEEGTGKARVVDRSECVDSRITCCVHVTAGFILLGTANGYVITHHEVSLHKLNTTWVMDCVLGIVEYENQVLVHLTNGSLVRFEGVTESGLYPPSILDISTSPLRTSLLVEGVLRDTDTRDELWCSSGNTLYFVDLEGWAVTDKMSISSLTNTQIHRIVAYSPRIAFISVHTTISIWDVHKKVCLSSHDCSSVFLPPPSMKSMSKSMSYQGVKMSIHSLFYDSISSTFWVGTSHGHVLIYDVNNICPDTEESDGDASVTVLSNEPPFAAPPSISPSSSSSGVKPIVEPDMNVQFLEEEEEDSLAESNVDPLLLKHNSLDASLVLISEPQNSSDPSFSEDKKPGLGRSRKDTCHEYDVMEDQCDIIESPSELQLGSPVHMYHTFNRYPSQDDTLHESDKEGDYEVIVDQEQCTLLSLNTYQILSGDPIAHMSSLDLAPLNLFSGETVSEASTGLVTCGGGLDQEGAVVLWRRVRDSDKSKSRWQAEPVSLRDS